VAENTKIEWCDHTWNPWVGCGKVSPACDHCYAEGWAKRTGQSQLWNGERRRTSRSNWRAIEVIDRKARDAGTRQTVFCASLGDCFDNQVPDEWRADMWSVIGAATNLDFLLLTKRPQNIARMLPVGWNDGWPNVWLGTTAEDGHHYRQRWHHLAGVPCRLRFLSYEPALGAIGDLDLGRVGAPEWIICGGESGPHARPMHPDWARSVRDQCMQRGVPFFFKQWGEWSPTSSVDIYCHGPGKNERQFPKSDGIAWLYDGRVCLRDFSVGEHRRRIKSGMAHSSRAVEVDESALRDFHTSVEDPKRELDNPLGYTWMYRVGKYRAGATLDGREWREMPHA
jgi:protein gp37